MTLRDPDTVVRELLPLVRAFCAGEPYGVALGGSHAKGTADAQSLGFNGTPSILVEGPKGQKPLSGFTLPEIQAAIQQVS